MPVSRLHIRSVQFDDTHVHLHLADGQRLSEFLSRNPRLQGADAARRAGWEPSADGLCISWPSLARVSVPDLVWDARYDNALKRLQARGWNLDALSPQDQQLVALWRMEADINNGGFMQFLCNWGDQTCQLALSALGAIGATRTHAALAGMRGLMDRFEDAPEITGLHDLHAALTTAEQQALGAFEDAWYAYPDDLARLGLIHFGPEPARPDDDQPRDDRQD
ncbi:DUF4375 domain-containing protein [Xanthomonas sp. XNM01]|uniref:DMP19 family protein n=1 Tax=Xanthomonas sp. XNM01 TaxID=2769289 RepID=UPI001782A26A|nr:DUF4375 domain-containing protein [Xanthomonas sp. XNM01]MBD9367721.1 DUF4375 domain-containing protein [Xanthomonas sp. XNM01]